MNSKLNGIYSKDVRTSFCFSFRALEYYIGGYICAHFAKGKEGFSSNLFMFNWFKSGSLSQGQHFPLKQHFASVVNMMISIFLTCILCALCGCVRGGCRLRSGWGGGDTILHFRLVSASIRMRSLLDCHLHWVQVYWHSFWDRQRWVCWIQSCSGSIDRNNNIQEMNKRPIGRGRGRGHVVVRTAPGTAATPLVLIPGKSNPVQVRKPGWSDDESDEDEEAVQFLIGRGKRRGSPL